MDFNPYRHASYVTDSPFQALPTDADRYYNTTAFIAPRAACGNDDDRNQIQNVAMTKYSTADGTYRYLLIEQLESKNVALRDKTFDESGHMFTVGLNFHF